MADVLNFMMLVCAIVGSMALGVLSAYYVFKFGFALMRPKRQPVPVKTQPEAAL